MNLVKTLIVLMLFSCLSATLAFGQGPAVSAVNGKVEALGGNFDSETGVVGGASLAVPLGERFGLQLDGALGEIDEDLYGFGAHVFTRDPERYLLGLNAVYVDLDNIELQRYGTELEVYLDKFTLVVHAGFQTGDVNDSGYAGLDLRYYPINDLLVVVGGSIADSNDRKVHIGAEYQVMNGLSAFVDLATGKNGYDHVLGGVRYYFGAKKSLIKRHREDDPDNNILTSLIGGYGSVLSKNPAAAAPAAASDEPSGGGTGGGL